jgi:predicted N-acetyltransferase YhbS
MPEDAVVPAWPAHLRPGAVRFARTSRHYDETVAFYRDVVGLPVVGEFRGSFDEDGTIFGFPDTSVQLEIVRARAGSVEGTFDQLVLYLDDAVAVADATAPLRAAGLTATDPHPYWAANGAVTYQDPDGRDVVFAPWVYGRDPEPADADEHVSTGSVAPPTTVVDWYDGDREALRDLFAEAEDSNEQLNAYINEGRVLVARRGDALVGHLQLVPAEAGALEVKNMAVAAALRGLGIGRRLIDAALAEAEASGARRVVVATAAADIGNLRFYQRCGFRMFSVEQNVFTRDAGYPDTMTIDGIVLRDRVWLEHLGR